MILDFSAVLVLLTFASGIIWAIDSRFFAPERRKLEKYNNSEKSDPVLVEYARSFFPVFLIVLVLRSFIVEPFRIPSDSMMPTLFDGDFILVNKYDYGIRLPVLNSKVIANSDPARGDIVVFRYPEDPSIPFIKRVIGVPGDHVIYRDKKLFINGTEIEHVPTGTFETEGAGWKNNGADELIEHLDTLSHKILHFPGYQGRNVEYTIPGGRYFVLGDNRDNSRDSRAWGLVPDENLVGRAFFIWMNWSSEGFFRFRTWDMNWDRIGSVII